MVQEFQGLDVEAICKSRGAYVCDTYEILKKPI